MAELVIAFFDLLEAEARGLRRALMRTGWALALAALAALLLAIAAMLWLWALYQWVLAALQPASAAALTGLVALALAGGIAWSARRLTR